MGQLARLGKVACCGDEIEGLTCPETSRGQTVSIVQLATHQAQGYNVEHAGPTGNR